MKYNTRSVKTVGALIRQLQKLPKSAKLDATTKPIYANISAEAKARGLKPIVILETD